MMFIIIKGIMEAKAVRFLFLSILLLQNHVMYNYNISYDGNDPYISYETSWGKERFVKDDYIRYFAYYEKYVEKIPFINLLNLTLSQEPAPYNGLHNILPFNPFGMFFNAKYISKLCENNDIVNVVEIGSYFGLSTRYIASLLPKGGKLYAIDSWQYFDGMYEQFLSNIVLKGLTQKVVPIKQRSDVAVHDICSLNMKFDLIYVDGDHETLPVLADLELYYPLLAQKGVICGDDWLIQSVRIAVLIFAQKHNLSVYGACNFWFLKDEGSYQVKDFLQCEDSVFTIQ